MGQFEYLLILASVILGLAVSDIAVSLNRLLEVRVRWDWLAPLAAALAFLKITTQWWGWYSGVSSAKGMTFENYVAVLVSAVLLFLMAAASLPDRLEESPFELRAYYTRVSRRYWLLFATQTSVSNATAFWINFEVSGQIPPLSSPFLLITFLLIVPAAVVLAFVRYRLLHSLCLVVLIGFYGTQLFGHRLGQ